MTLSEKREFLEQSLTLLVTHEPFKVFVQQLVAMRDAAVQDACATQNMDSTRIAAALGEVRTYLDILALVDEFAQKTLE